MFQFRSYQLNQKINLFEKFLVLLKFRLFYCNTLYRVFCYSYISI